MNDYVHPTGDQVLNVLSNVEGIIGKYVRHYPGKERTDVNPKWVENWFVERAKHYLESPRLDEISSIDLDELLADVVKRQVSIVKQPATLLSIWPHYFRGFRSLPDPINLAGKLIVVEGRNSSGKTSLAEAFEWLLSGQLVRRCLNDMGDSKELESCIGYQLIPDDEQTWVEAEFLVSEGEVIKIRRVLTQDYGCEKGSLADSDFYLDGRLLSRDEEEIFLDNLLAGIPPVLMQHSLRTFVLSTPRQRRDYFERLLRLDEIADLIEKSVVGDARLSEFPSALGSVSWKAWENLKNQVQPDSRKALRKVEQAGRASIVADTESALLQLARTQFGITDTSLNFEETKRVIESAQQQKREKSFPLLENLRPRRVIDPYIRTLFLENDIVQSLPALEEDHKAVVSTKKAVEKIGTAQILIVQTLEELSKLGVIIETPDNQICPLCEYSSPTLSSQRVSEIRSWQPIQEAAQEAEQKYSALLEEIKSTVNEIALVRAGLIPNSPHDSEWSEALLDGISEPIKESVAECKKVLWDCITNITNFDETIRLLATLLSEDGEPLDIAQLSSQISQLVDSLPVVIDKAHEYLDAFSALENVVGKQAREDPDYYLREVWLSLGGSIDSLTSDFLWEQAKKKAQTEIERIRQFLISTRDRLIEARRIAFSDGMTAIWGKLRSDKYSTFSRLFIPPARGKGLPLEIEVKAILDDGIQKKEVDALRVFSESQINILGIAAFATRSKLIGHRLIVLDDPVQSMDEEHFKTFCSQLLPELIGENGQVIILTHNETFARELSFSWDDKDDDYYVTMSIDHTRKLGCTVEEGSRRVSERLKRADKYVENGDLEKAWLAVRRAVERLYTLIRIKHGEEGFDHLSWRNATAEDMWKQGVKDIVSAKAPDATRRLEEIVAMTAAAAHDKRPYGATDLTNATSFMRQLVPKLRIGG